MFLYCKIQLVGLFLKSRRRRSPAAARNNEMTCFWKEYHCHIFLGRIIRIEEWADMVDKVEECVGKL